MAAGSKISDRVTEVKEIYYTIMNNSTNKFYENNSVLVATALLEAEGILVSQAALGRIGQFLQLVLEWNDFAHLVSAGDTGRLTGHVVDSLGLAGYVRAFAGSRGWLDIGTGGGFPALVVKCVLPEVPLWMVERNERKAGFLIRAVAALGIPEARVIRAEFPRLPERVEAGVVTARAVERPEKVAGAILGYMGVGTTWLCQGAAPEGACGERFHVEHVVDAWAEQGLRRGALHRVTRV